VFAVFSFLITFYFSSMIKTEMVVLKDPITITTYAQILERRVRPLFADVINDDADFKYADAGTDAAKIWQLAQTYGIKSCLLSSDADILRVLPDCAVQKAVWLGSLYITDLALKNICPLMRKQGLYNHINPLMTADASAREKIVGLPFSSSMSEWKTRRYLRLTTSFLELGIVIKTIKLMEFQASPFTGSKELMECLSNKIIAPDHEFHPVKATHYKQLFVISSILLSTFAVVLLIELLFQMKRRTKTAETSASNNGWTLVHGHQVPPVTAVRSIALTR
jgi:hypothetical protein